MDEDDRYTSLSIASVGPSTLTNAYKPKHLTAHPRDFNDISDIDGAKSINRHEHFGRISSFQINDVEGSTPKPRTHTRNTKDLSLCIDDIIGTKRIVRDRMAFTKRHVNPLNPDYKLPSYIPFPSEEPRFLRDAMDHSDISGTFSKSCFKKELRDTLQVRDILDSETNHSKAIKWMRHDAQPRDNLNVNDITVRHRYIDRTTRSSNNVDPSYHIHGIDIADNPKYTKPKEAKKFIPENHLLQTTDIPGATVGWIAEQKPVREIKNTNFIGDIEGAQADTIRFCTFKEAKRTANPLYPVYDSLDGDEKLMPIIKPLMPPELTKTPTLRIPRITDNLKPSSGKKDVSGREKPEMKLDLTLGARNDFNSTPNGQGSTYKYNSFGGEGMTAGNFTTNNNNPNWNMSQNPSPYFSGFTSPKDSSITAREMKKLNVMEKKAALQLNDEIMSVRQL